MCRRQRQTETGRRGFLHRIGFPARRSAQIPQCRKRQRRFPQDHGPRQSDRQTNTLPDRRRRTGRTFLSTGEKPPVALRDDRQVAQQRGLGQPGRKIAVAVSAATSMPPAKSKSPCRRGSRIEVEKGWNTSPMKKTIDVTAATTEKVELTIERTVPMSEHGYYNGDIHLHFPREPAG